MDVTEDARSPRCKHRGASTSLASGVNMEQPADDSMALRLDAERAFQSFDLQRALKLYTAAIELEPDDPE